MNAPFANSSPVRTSCPYCGVGCGLLVQPDGRGGAAVAGDPAHPANFGRLCAKGSALGETLGLEGRLLHPMLRQADGTLVRVDWDRALETVATGLQRIIERDGPDAVAFYLSGQLLTEDYYVANKLMKGFLGSANVDTNSRLCMASAVAGQRRAFGADTVPGSYSDFDAADLLVLVGSNAAWCHPVLFQRMAKNKAERGAKIVVIDPRRTVTAEEADLFLAVEPGTDTALFCALLVDLADRGALDETYIKRHTTGIQAALTRARAIAPNVEAAAAATGLAPADVRRFFDLFATTERVVTAFSQGVNQSAQGTDKVNAIINCHLATGRIGKSGMGPFSLTGQPNAMGGREVGGLANQLASHMDFSPEHVDRVGRFWRASQMATREGLKAVQMFEAIERGEIRALWVMATNPAVSLPRAGAARQALKKLELFVVSENVISNDTVKAGAHVLLPAAAWGEKDGTATNSERRISRQRAFMTPPGEAKPDWLIVAQVAERMGFAEAFAYRSAADVFREHAALSGFENDGTRDFDIGGLAVISDQEFDALEPVQWPVRAAEARADRRFFAAGGYFTPDRKARFVAPEFPALREPTSMEFPFRLNTGRIRDQWHSMTRTGKSARLSAHLAEPFVEVHPDDARGAGLADGDLAHVLTPHGTCILRVAVSDGQRRGSVFVPIHWSDETASSARVGDLVSPSTDPYSGQPEAKATPAAISPARFSLRGLMRTRNAVALPAETWWVRIPRGEGMEIRFATNHGVLVWHDLAYRLLGPDTKFADQLDASQDVYRAAGFVDGELEGWLCLGPADVPLHTDALASLIPAEERDNASRRLGLNGAGAMLELEPMVCACFGVGADAIRKLVASGKACRVEDIGKHLGAGTNCGSCLPEIRRIVSRERTAQPV